MKKWLIIWLGAAVCAAICAAAAFFSCGWLRLIIILVSAEAWLFFLVRFCLVKYRFSDSEIVISGGAFFKYSKTVKRSSVLSESRLYLGRLLVCTIIRTPKSTHILFCSLE